MAWDVEGTDEFADWFKALGETEQVRIGGALDRLADIGPSLAYPQSSDVKGSRHGQMRELRVQIKGEPYRIFYAFDPRRVAIVLLGASKQGESDKLFYGRMVPLVDNLYDDYLVELRTEGLIT